MSSPPTSRPPLKNELEEAFLRRFLTDTKPSGPRDAANHTSPLKQTPRVIEKKRDALIHMRCAQRPTALIQWREVNEVHDVGVMQKLQGTLERIVVKPRVVQWVVRLAVVPSVACAVNGIAVKERGVALQLGDVLTIAADSAASLDGAPEGGEMWLVEAGPAYQVVATDEGIMPCVVSTSPFVVAEAAANSEYFSHVEAQVQLLEDRVALCAGAAGEKITTSKRFTPEAADAPQLRLHRRLEWLMSSLERLDQHLRRIKRSDKEVQTTHSGGVVRDALTSQRQPYSASSYRPVRASTVAALDATSRFSHAGPRVIFDESSGGSPKVDHDATETSGGMPAAVALKAALHQLWVSEVRYRALCARSDGASELDAAQVTSALSERVEHLLHVNAELQRRLNQRLWRLHRLEEEVRQLRAACVDAEGQLEMQTSVEELKRLLLAAASPSPPSSSTGAANGATEPRPLTAAEEGTLWRCVANTLHYVSSLENSLRRADLQVEEAVRRGQGPHQRAVDELREEISALRADGSVDATAALQQTLRYVMIEFGGAGQSTMSAWT